MKRRKNSETSFELGNSSRFLWLSAPSPHDKMRKKEKGGGERTCVMVMIIMSLNSCLRSVSAIFLEWIDRNLRPIVTFNARHTSYGLKHLVTFESDKDSYFTNGEFKGAMLQAGYKVRNKKTQNWVFNVSEQSPVFKAKKAQR